MGIFKKILFALGVLILLILGSLYFGEDMGFSSGSGLLGLIIGAIVVYIFFKMILKAIGCLPALIIILGIIFFILYAIGALNGGGKEIIPNIKNFLEAKDTPQEEGIILFEEDSHQDLHINENFEDLQVEQNEDIEAEPSAEEKPKENIIKKLTANSNKTKEKTKPHNYPMVYGNAKVITADTLLIRNHVIRLYGIAAPSQKQTCADNKGHPYTCGKKAARWLQNWILDGEINCRILQKTPKYMVATCSYGEYDLGAALIMAGWAVALPQNKVYAPYEEEAKRNRSGMWNGTFYKPWDWEKIQNQKPKIKVIKPKTNKKRLWDYL
ncbi:MAG: thermonuclease family protein [Alphaproteobacteria bacterium]|nr:thermonuclease family protein [Alphaproteobacteria bacterium]